MNRTLLSVLLFASVILTLHAQIYTPSGTIQGSSSNNNVGIGTSTPNSQLSLNKVSAILGDPQSISLYEDSLVNYGFGVNGAHGGLDFCANQAVAGVGFRFYCGADKIAPSEKMRLMSNGNLGIGTTNPDAKLTVNGTIHATEVKVTQTVPADYVFQKYYTGESSLKPDYTLLTLSEVEEFTKANHHLPNVPSAKEIKEKGLHLGEMSNMLLQKIEELTLYSIAQQKTIEKLEKENDSLKNLEERLSKMEKELEAKK